MPAEQEKKQRDVEIEERKFRDFIDEINGFYSEEKEGKVETVHFLPFFDKNGKRENVFDPEALKPEDMAMWEKVKDGSITEGEFRAYRATIPESENVSRKMFCAFIANKATKIISKR